MSSAARSYLLVRRGENLWGLSDAVVEGRNGSGGFRIRSGTELLAVDEILDVVEGLRVHPPGRLLARWWPEVVEGLAVHRRVPVLVIGPGQAPEALRETPRSRS